MTDKLSTTILGFDKFMRERFTGKYYHLSELVSGQGESYPVTAVATKRDRVAPSDSWQLQTYHRVISSVRDDENTFGRNSDFIIQMRQVVIANPNMGEDFIYRFVAAFPKQIFVHGAYSIIEAVDNIDHDHSQIAAVEFGTAWQDKHRLTKNIWSIDYTIRLTFDSGCNPEDIICEWILTDSFWDDKGCWLDSDKWND